MIGKLLDIFLLSENICQICGKRFKPETQGYICENCLSEVKPYEYFEDIEEIENVDYYDFFSLYEGVLREVLILYKFKSVKPFGKLIAQSIKEHFNMFIQEVNPDVITFVPVHFFRYWSRGYDHNEEILKNLEVYFRKVLKRKRYSKPLARIEGKEKRKEKVRDAYEVIENVYGMRVLVLDDILTTGSTASEVARILKENGAEEVYFYFICKEKRVS